MTEYNVTCRPTIFGLSKNILLFSLPLMLSNVLQVLFHMADVAVVGQFSGTLALGAVGSTAVAITIFTGFLIGMGGGINAIIARNIGEQNTPEIRKTIHTGTALSLIIGVIIMLFGLFGSRPLLMLLGTKDELIDLATDYMTIYFLGMPALAIFNLGNAVYSAEGDTRKPLIFLSISGVLNVLLNLFFVIVLRLSVVGVAISSVISQYLSGVLVVRSLMRKQSASSLSLRELRITGKNAAEILSLGLPSGFQHAVFYIANLFIQSAVNTFDAVMVAGNSAATNADGLVFDVMAAIYVATASFIGRSYGRGDKREIKRIYFVTLVLSAVIGELIGLTLVLLGPHFLSVFSSDPAVIDAGMQRLLIMGSCYGISAFMDNAIAAARGLGKSIIPALCTVMFSCIFRIIWIYTVFDHFRTIASIYLLYPVSWILTTVCATAYFFYCYSKLRDECPNIHQKEHARVE